MDSSYGKCQQQCDNCRKQKNKPLHINVAAKTFQPVLNAKICQGPANQIGDQD